MYIACPAATRSPASGSARDLAGGLDARDAGRCPDTRDLPALLPARGLRAAIAFDSDDYKAIQGSWPRHGRLFIPDLALVAVREDIVIRSGPARARAPRRRGDAGRLVRAPRPSAAMLDVLVEVGGEVARRRDALALAG